MRTICVLGVSLWLAATAFAQQPPGDGERGERRRPRPERMNYSPRELSNRLAPRLGLTATQQQQLDALVAKHQADWDQSAGQVESMRTLRQQYRDARDSGDSQRADELAAQMRQMGGGGGRAVRAFFQEVEGILQPQQVEQLNAFRQELRSEMQPGGDRRGRMREMMESLPDELDLTPEQRVQYQQLLEQQRAEMQARGGPSGEMRQLFEELRAARESGDDARVAEIREQLAASRPQFTFFDKLEAILTEEQKATLADIRAEQMGGGGDTGGRLDVRRVLSAARRLDLNDHQREQVREISRATQRSNQQADTAEERAALAETVKQQIVSVLTPEQAKQFNELLERGGRDRERTRQRRPGVPDEGTPAEGTPGDRPADVRERQQESGGQNP